MTLHAVEYLPSETNLTVCYPRMVGGRRGVFQLEYDPFIDEPDARVSLKAVRDRIEVRAFEALPPVQPVPEITPEVTDEMVTPTASPVPPTPTPAPPTATPTPEKCLDVGVSGLAPDEEGVLHINIDELRTDMMPTAVNVHLVNAALEQIGSRWRVHFDTSNGMGITSAEPTSPSPRFHDWRVLQNVISDITSERLLGPWTFSVPLE